MQWKHWCLFHCYSWHLGLWKLQVHQENWEWKELATRKSKCKCCQCCKSNYCNRMIRLVKRLIFIICHLIYNTSQADALVTRGVHSCSTPSPKLKHFQLGTTSLIWSGTSPDRKVRQWLQWKLVHLCPAVCVLREQNWHCPVLQATMAVVHQSCSEGGTELENAPTSLAKHLWCLRRSRARLQWCF